MPPLENPRHEVFCLEYRRDLCGRKAYSKAGYKAAGNVADANASLVIGKPRRREDHETILQNCWEPEDARKFLDTAKAESAHAAALYSLALDSGARKAELCGLKWSEVDIERQSISIVRQLVKVRNEPLFGPPKNGKSRTILLDEKTIEVLRKQKAAQAAKSCC
jgi:integrase